jgi:hypothetical protein
MNTVPDLQSKRVDILRIAATHGASAVRVKTPDLYLAQILECLAKVQAYTVEGRAAFLADTKTQRGFYA